MIIPIHALRVIVEMLGIHYGSIADCCGEIDCVVEIATCDGVHRDGKAVTWMTIDPSSGMLKNVAAVVELWAWVAELCFQGWRWVLAGLPWER